MDFVFAGGDFAVEAGVAEAGENIGDVGALFYAELDDVVTAEDGSNDARAVEIVTNVVCGCGFTGEGIGEKSWLGNR